jgi:hypothetical protein
VQLYQLTPNAIVQISKFIWAITSCGAHPTADLFTQHYELRYQNKKIWLHHFSLQSLWESVEAYPCCVEQVDEQVGWQLVLLPSSIFLIDSKIKALACSTAQLDCGWYIDAKETFIPI